MQTRSAAVSISIVCACITLFSGTASLSAQPPETDQPLDAVELPVSLERIRRQLDRLPVVESERDVLRLSFYVRVYGTAPDVNVLEGYDLHNGPVPYGTPTHARMREVTTPVEFSSPAVNFGNVLGWSWGGR